MFDNLIREKGRVPNERDRERERVSVREGAEERERENHGLLTCR